MSKAMKKYKDKQYIKSVDYNGRLRRIAIRFIKWLIRRNRKTMSLLALDKREIETEIDLIILKNRQLESELAEWEKEL